MLHPVQPYPDLISKLGPITLSKRIFHVGGEPLQIPPYRVLLYFQAPSCISTC